MSPKLLTRFGPKIIARIALAGVAAWMMGSTLLSPAGEITDDSSTTLNTPESAIDWAELTRADLQAAYAITLENHPGVYNDLDPDFRAMAANALENVLELATRVENVAGYEYALDAFAAEFQDGHFRFYLTKEAEEERQYTWPGFLITWRQDRGFVHSALDAQANLVGAEVISCDDRPIREVVLANIFEFGGNSSVLGHWIKYAPQVFIDSGNPFINRPQQCLFRLTNGMQRGQELQWASIAAADWIDQYLLMTDGPKEMPSLEPFGEGRYWISMATLFPHSELEVEQLETLITQVEEQKASLRNAEAIVIDLRRATGGSSIWMKRVANALWGEAFVNSIFSDDESYSEYRASQGNLDYLKTLLDIPALVNAPPDTVQFFNDIIAGVERAYENGEPLYSTKSNPNSRGDETVAATSAELSNPVSADIYVFVTGPCGSACLDAIDLLSQFEQVTLVGMPTSADTDYNEVRDVILPSKQAVLGFPIKVDRNRSRSSGFYYEPDIPYPSLDLSRAAVESWLVEIIGDRSANAVSKRRDRIE